MSTTLIPTITTVGNQAVFNINNTGLQADITHIALGDAAYTPSVAAFTLQQEQSRYPIAGGERIDDNQLHITALADDDKEFWVREVGFFLEGGELLAVWSDELTPLAFKSKHVDLLLAFDLVLTALPAQSVTVQPGDAGLNLAMAEEIVRIVTTQIDTMRRQLEMHERLLQLEAKT